METIGDQQSDLLAKRNGGDAILEAFRNLGVDYVFSALGSNCDPLLETLGRQKANGSFIPIIHCWHEALAVDMALGYARITGRLQAVLLPAGPGLLQGSIAIHGASLGEVPVLICSCQPLSNSGSLERYSQEPCPDLGPVWGSSDLVKSFTKWSGHAINPCTLYQLLVMAGGLAQRAPKGPTLLNIPLESFAASWSSLPPGEVAAVPKTQPTAELVDHLAAVLVGSTNPLILTDSAGNETGAFQNLRQLAELLAIPVVESDPTCSNFPKAHPLHMGFSPSPYLKRADVVLLVGCRAPWYPPSSGPAQAKVIAMGESPIKGQMAYQNLMADLYVEGDLALTLGLLVESLKRSVSVNDQRVAERRLCWEAEHRQLQERNQAAVGRARTKRSIDSVLLCAALSEVIPENAVYIEETTSHHTAILQQIKWEKPHSYLRPDGGLGQGLGLALGAKLAKTDQPVIALMGDGGMLYNPIVQSFRVAVEAELPLLMVVFNNGRYEAMRRNHLQYYPMGEAASSGIFYGVNINGPDFAQLVAPFGGHGERVTEPTQLVPALHRALAALNEGKLALVDVVLSDEERGLRGLRIAARASRLLPPKIQRRIVAKYKSRWLGRVYRRLLG